VQGKKANPDLKALPGLKVRKEKPDLRVTRVRRGK
jgi:hypothetical protein